MVCPLPLVVLCAGGMHSALLLLLTLCFCFWLLRSGSWAFWTFCILLSIICPNWTCTQLFLVPYSFFVLCCWRRLCPVASTAAKGPRSQVPACLRLTKGCERTVPSLKEEHLHGTLHTPELSMRSGCSWTPATILLSFLPLFYSTPYTPFLLRAAPRTSLSQKYPLGLWVYGIWPQDTWGQQVQTMRSIPGPSSRYTLPSTAVLLLSQGPEGDAGDPLELRQVWSERIPSST